MKKSHYQVLDVSKMACSTRPYNLLIQFRINNYFLDEIILLPIILYFDFLYPAFNQQQNRKGTILQLLRLRMKTSSLRLQPTSHRIIISFLKKITHDGVKPCLKISPKTGICICVALVQLNKVFLGQRLLQNSLKIDLVPILNGNSNKMYNKVNYHWIDISQTLFITPILSILQQYHMYNQFFIVYPNPYLYQALPATSIEHPYPCSFYGYNPVPLQQSIQYQPEIESAYHYEHSQAVKEEEQSSKPQSDSEKSVSRFKYGKKNVQSNVVNQCFSYLTTRSKSYPKVMRILGSQQKVSAFYEIMKQAKKKQTKYMGRMVLQSLLELSDDHPVYILHKKLRYKVALKLSQIRHALRLLIAYFLGNLIVPTILTSNKMDRSTIAEHLARAREIKTYLALPAK